MILYLVGLSLLFILALHIMTYIATLRHVQRVKLMLLYSELYHELRAQYKEKKSSFKDKVDFLYFGKALGWVAPYLHSRKSWESLSDEEMAGLGVRLLRAEKKYPSPLARSIEDKLGAILLCSIILDSPCRSLFKAFLGLPPFVKYTSKGSNKEGFFKSFVDFSFHPASSKALIRTHFMSF